MSSPPPNDMEGSTSPPPPVMQIPLVPSPSPLPHIPPTPAEAPVPPANSPPPIATPPVSPSPLVVVAAPSPTAISPPSNPVTSPLPPTPPISSLSPPLLLPPPSQLPPTPRAPELPPSQPGTSLPPQATPKVSPPPPPPPLRTPFQPSPTWPKYTPPTGHPPTPPNSAVRPSSKSLPSASLPVNSKQADISTGLIAGCVIGGVLLLVVLGFICICCKNKRRRTIIQDHFKQPPSAFKPQVFPEDGLPQREDAVRVQITSSRDSNSGSSWYANPLPIQASAPHVPSTASTGTFTYDELVVATNAFSESNLIGEGGFGLVHKGFLGSGQAVAVKQLKEGSTQGEREFQAEVEIISRVHHKHLVSLIGYCIAGNKRLLVYEFVPNNTLEFHLHRNKQSVMEWATRLKIAVGSAKGLAYIHEDCNPTIIHRDIKAANILLDHNFEAKVSDFGLAKSFPLTRTGITHISTRVVGTFGYMAPEYATSGKLTEKSDVYSYGVMLLELITGYPPISEDNYVLKEGLVEWARPLLTQALEDTNFEALVDPQLEKKYNTNEMASMLACAAACVRRSSWLRPRMSQIVRVLEGDISIMDLNGGMKPGHSNMYGFDSFDSCSSYHDLFQHNMSLPKWQNGNRTTTQYGLKPSSC